MLRPNPSWERDCQPKLARSLKVVAQFDGSVDFAPFGTRRRAITLTSKAYGQGAVSRNSIDVIVPASAKSPKSIVRSVVTPFSCRSKPAT